MPTQLEKLQQSLDKKPSMLMEVSELKDIMVTKMQVKQVLEALIKKLQDGEKRLSEMVSQTDSALKADYEKFSKDVKDQIDDVKATAKKVKDDLLSDQRTLSRLFDQKLDELRMSVPDMYDDSAVMEKLTGLEKRLDDLNIPEEFDSTELVEQLEELIEEHAAMKKDLGRVKGAANVPSPVNWQRNETFSVGSSDTFITLAQAPGQAGAACIVWYQGQALEPGNHYTVDGNKITFSGFTFVDSTTVTVSYWP